jgi:hypothetical protein
VCVLGWQIFITLWGGKIKQKDIILFLEKSPKFYDIIIIIIIILFWEEVCHILVVFLVQGTHIQIVLRYLDCFKKKPLPINAKSFMG